jgi:hypothetical protein
MKPRKKRRISNHIAKLDDYELKPHYDFDYRKSKPNRFAGRVIFSHGRVRRGSSRKRAPERIERHTITLYKTHADYLRRLDANLSKAIRKLVAKAK